jgi:hypothetical protein
MMWMVILSFCIFASYVAVMAVKYGAKEVVSEYAYEGGMTLFTACIGASAALLMPVMVAVAPENWKFLGFLAAAALVFVAVAPHYKGDEAKLHKTAAKIAGVCAVAWAMATCWKVVALSLVAYIAMMQVTKSRCAWIAAELTGMGMVYAVCFYKLMV